MISILETIAPKSDQLNADDLIGGLTKIIKITKVSITMGEQPVSIHFEGDNGKPYKPGKSMRRVIVAVWGADANVYVGRFLTLYNDEKVTFGGVETGGIRISHMSHIERPITIPLTTSRSKKKPFTVKPLNIQGSSSIISESEIEELKKEGHEIAKEGLEALRKWWMSQGGVKQKQMGGSEFLANLKSIAVDENKDVETTELPEKKDVKKQQKENKSTEQTKPVTPVVEQEQPEEIINIQDDDNFYPEDF